MDIRQALLREHSKTNSLRIKDWIGTDETRFAQLMELFLADEYRVTQRAAWVLDFCATDHPKMVFPYLETLIMNLKNKPHVAVVRNTLRFLQNIEIPGALLGHATQICFEILYDPNAAIAVKVFAMTVIANICEREPDLTNELSLLIEEEMRHGGPAIQSRGKRLLKKLEKINRKKNTNH